MDKTAHTVRATDSLYERDPYTWAFEQARALRERRVATIDWENVAEEIEDVGKREADALQSHDESLIEHLLKLTYAAPAVRRDNARLWCLSIRSERRRIADVLDENPGLKGRTDELFRKAWPYARNKTLGALGLDDDVIPIDCPWTFEQVLDEDFPEVQKNGGKQP
ncbi:MAG: DUF29 domain-containing protein [Candidatus Binataceae bacterium]